MIPVTTTPSALLEHQLTGLVAAHRAADDEAGVTINHDAEIKPNATDDTDVRNISHPLGVRRVGSKVPGKVILDIRRTCAR